MATYTLFSSSALTTTTASVTFSSIPSTYTDLVLKVTARLNSGASTSVYQVRLNGVSTGSAYSNTGAYYDGTGSTGFALTSDNGIRSNANDSSGTGATTSAFGHGEHYFPGYNETDYIPIGSDKAGENNGIAYMSQTASQFRGGSAITSITVFGTSDSFVSGSSFYLYGISNT